MWETLRTMRKAAHMTQKELGIAAGLTQPFISELESGAKTASMDTLERLAAALQTSVVNLLGAGGQHEDVTGNHDGVGTQAG